MSNPDPVSSYWQEPAAADSDYRDGDYVYRGDRGAARGRGPRGDSARGGSAGGDSSGGDSARGGPAASAPRGGYDPRGGAGSRNGSRARGGSAGPGGWLEGQGPGRGPRPAADAGQVAQNLRDRLGVRGSRDGQGPAARSAQGGLSDIGFDGGPGDPRAGTGRGSAGAGGPRGRSPAGGTGYGPRQNGAPANGARQNGAPANGARQNGARQNGRGPAAAGYASTGYADRSYAGGAAGPGAAEELDWDSRGEPRSHARRAGGPGGTGGPGGPGGGRRGFRQWLLYGRWWRHWTWKKAVAVVLGLGIGVCLLLVAGFFAAYSSTRLPTLTTVDATAQPSKVYYSDGNLMATISNGGPNRQILSTMPPVMKNAIIAAEDRKFYTEGGISLTGILRAAYEDAKGGSYVQGGSTLTEQLVKNYYAGFNSGKAAGGKFKEILVAIKLAHAKSKNWILTQYLNTVYFGQNAYGVGAAAKVYFNEPASQLTIRQAAMLAAMVNQPSYFTPDKHAGASYQALVSRWKYVLNGMVVDKALTPAQAVKIEQRFPTVHFHTAAALDGYRGYLEQMVTQELERTYHYTQKQLDTDGLAIRTTFRQSLEKGLYKVVNEEKLQMTQLGDPLPAYAFIGSVLERPSDGAILAVYGGPGYSTNVKKCAREDCDYNMAENPKQVGSSFKPYVLAEAVKQGMNVETSTLNGNSPLWIPENQSEAGRMELSSETEPPDCCDGYLPFNESSEKLGPLTVAKAAAESSDPAFMDLAHRDGVQNVITMAQQLGVGATPFTIGGNDLTALNQQFGIHSTEQTGGSVAIALGEGDLTAVEQTSMFATFADNGLYHSPHVVASIMQGHKPIALKIKTAQVLTVAQAADVDYALSFDNVPGGTAYPQAAWREGDVIGKTGTTQTAQDAWFLGAIPQYSMGVAIFTNKQDSATGPGAETLDNLPDLAGNQTGGYGGAWPAKIWETFMSQEFVNLPPKALPPPDLTGFVTWNQVTGQTAPTPSPPAPTTTPPATASPPAPTCSPQPGNSNCQPGGSSPPTTTLPPTTPPTTAPTCQPGSCQSTPPPPALTDAAPAAQPAGPGSAGSRRLGPR